MKKKIIAVITLLCLAGTSAAFARGYNHGYRGHYTGYRGGYHHHGDGLGIALGVAGGLLLGSALFYAASPPPPPAPVVYDYRPSSYQPEVIVQQPRVCFEEMVVGGEWQASRYDGRQVWVPYSSPVRSRVQVPCY
jgi:hypothetical protein